MKSPWNTTHLYTRPDSLIHHTWLTHKWFIIQTWNDFSYLTWLFSMWHDSFIRDTIRLYVPWLIRRHMNHSYMSRLFTCDMNCSYAPITYSYGTRINPTILGLVHKSHDSFDVTLITHTWHDYSYLTWLIFMWHDSFIRDTVRSYVSWLMRVHMNRSYVTRLFTSAMTHLYMT